MNKLLKGAVAGAAGLTLLLGGAGTYAFWNDSVAVDSAAVTAGVLKAKPVSAGTWTASVAGGPASTVTNLNSYRIIPGTVLTYTRDVRIVARGNGLTASLSVDAGSLAANANILADNALAAELGNTAVVSISGVDAPEIVAGPAAGEFTVTTAGNAAVNDVVTVTVTLSLPNSPTEQNAAQAGSVNLENVAITLLQTQATVN